MRPTPVDVSAKHGEGTAQMRRQVPLTLRQANEMVSALHRHHKPVRGHRFSIGLEVDGLLVGAVIVGRPVARMADAYRTAEVTRMVTDGTPNACSALYAAAARAAQAIGFDRIQTFILATEPGTSLRAAGWVKETDVPPSNQWDSRAGRRDDQPRTAKTRWAKVFRPQYTEDDPDWAAMVSPISDTDGGHDDR